MAENGTAALERVTAARSDGVILDLGLPDLDGIQLLIALRSVMPAPIIILSGRSGATDIIGSLNADADDYVTKPFGIGELVARLRHAVGACRVIPRRRSRSVMSQWILSPARRSAPLGSSTSSSHLRSGDCSKCLFDNPACWWDRFNY